MNSNTLYLLVLLAFVFSLIAQGMTNRTYDKYSKFATSSGLTGGEVARRILAKEGIENVRIEVVNGKLTDHYDPQSLTLRLSSATMYGQNVAAVGVAAHEVGHVLQHRDAYAPLSLRTACVKTVNIGSHAAWPIFLLGLILSYQPLLYVGIGLYAAIVFFTVITLPVEFNASHRALSCLTSDGYLTHEEASGARSVLSAAAMTYVAAALSAILQLLRLMAIANNNRRRN